MCKSGSRHTSWPLRVPGDAFWSHQCSSDFSVLDEQHPTTVSLPVLLVFFNDILIYSSSWSEHGASMSFTDSTTIHASSPTLPQALEMCFWRTNSGIPRPRDLHSWRRHGQGQGGRGEDLACTPLRQGVTWLSRTCGLLPQIYPRF